MTKAIIFDLTQTLQVFDFARMRKEFKKILQAMPSCSKITTKKFMLAYQRAYDLYQIGKIKNDKAFAKKIFFQLKVQPNKKEIAFFLREHKQCRKKFIRLPKKLKSILHGLKNSGFKIGMLSNCVNNWLPTDWKFLRFQPKKFFSAEVSSQQTGIKKPDARTYALVLKKLNVLAHDAIMVGDNYEHDILAPKKLGLKTVWLNKLGKRKKADFVIKEFKELSKIKKALLKE